MKIGVVVAGGFTIFNFFLAVKTGGVGALAVSIILLFFALVVFGRAPDGETNQEE